MSLVGGCQTNGLFCFRAALFAMSLWPVGSISRSRRRNAMEITVFFLSLRVSLKGSTFGFRSIFHWSKSVNPVFCFWASQLGGAFFLLKKPRKSVSLRGYG